MADQATLTPEEKLFVALSAGEAVDGHLERLGSLSDLDSRGFVSLNLLHSAVRLGRVDWVVRLLTVGACVCSIMVHTAEEACASHPEDGDRRQVLQLVSVVHERESRKDKWGSASTTGKRRASEEGPRAAVLSRLEQGMATVSDCYSRLAAVLEARLDGGISSLRGEMQEAREEARSRDAILSKLEEGTTTVADRCTRIEQVVSGAADEPTEEVVAVDPSDTWVHRVMAMTVLQTEDTSGREMVLRMYQRMLDGAVETSCILSFLQCHPQVKIRVDCGSICIVNMLPEFKDYDGGIGNGHMWSSFADFDRKTLYLGGMTDAYRTLNHVVPRFVAVLSLISMFLAFGNEGRPYKYNDTINKRRYRAIVVEAEGKKSRGEVLDEWITGALECSTNRGKEILLISIVPYMIAKYGSLEARTKLRQQLPALLHYYDEHVINALFHSNKTTVSTHMDQSG